MTFLWAEPGKAAVLVDGAFGSTGKGLIAAWLAENGPTVDIATTNAGAQAGHTTRYRAHDHFKQDFICYHLPTVAVVQHRWVQHSCLAYVNAGSIIDVDVLKQELIDTKADPHLLVIHPRAAVITEADRATERDPTSATAKTASTQKGVGAALVGKIMRRAPLAKDTAWLLPFLKVLPLNEMLTNGKTITVEVPQGFGLSLNHGLDYPHCTSRDCWVGSALSDAGIHPSFLGRVCMVVRSFPIRVGAIRNEMGQLIGMSGPFYPDSQELDWEKDFPGIEPERTTVTKRIRRIATWSDQMYHDALVLNRPNLVALTFCDYFKGVSDYMEHVHHMMMVQNKAGIHPGHIYSVGPCVEDVMTITGDVCDWLTKRGPR